MSTSVCEHVLSASCHLYWIPPGVCVLSPLLYIMYTDDCRSNQENSYIVKFADDSALLSPLQGTQDGHGAALDDFTEWCDELYLDLNMSKTKEMIVDFRRRGHTHEEIQTHGEAVERVHSHKYLGTIFEDTLKWDLNTEAITRK